MLASDTILRQAIGTTYFYNFCQIKSEIYLGSNAGIYLLDSTTLNKINDKEGYLHFIDNKLEIKATSGIKRDYMFKNLLPRSLEKYQHQSIVDNNYIYIICKGTLFIYEVNDLAINMKGKSIRCFTKNSIGTYSGIYCFGERLKIPTYTTGSILEIDSTFYICYDGLAIHKPKKDIEIFTRATTGEAEFNNHPLGFARDIVRMYDSTFILFTTKGIYQLSNSFEIKNTIFERDDNNPPVLIELFDEPYTRVLTFASNDTLYRYGIESHELLKLCVLQKPIISGYKQIKESVSEFILLTEDIITCYNYSTNKEKHIPGLYQAHSAISLGLDSVLISSQSGIYIALLNTNELFHLYKGVEFNKRALYRDSDSIKMGTVDGYISLTKNQLISKVIGKQNLHERPLYLYSWTIILIGLVVLIFIIYIHLIFRKKTLQSSSLEISKITLPDIEEYVQQNLNQVTIKSIRTHFKLNNKSLYKITLPQKPGNLITKIRKQKANELFTKGHSFKEIAKQTGFSVSYLKKIINRKQIAK